MRTPDRWRFLLVGASNLAAWGGLLLSADAVWWDDWIVFDATLEQTQRTAREAGLLWGYVLGVLSRGGPTFISLLAVLAYLIASLLMLQVLFRVPRISPAEATFGAAVFATVPLMEARHAAVHVIYIISVTCVLGVWVILTRPQPLRWSTSAALSPLLLVAALIPSSGLFLVVPVLHLLWMHRGLRDARTTAFVVAALGLPVAQLVLQRAVLPARGTYEGYNQIDLGNLAGMAAITLIFAAVAVVAARSIWGRGDEGWLDGVPTVLVGGTLCALALTPYIAVGQIPPWGGWNTRHELLLPIGVAVAATGAARVLRVVASQRLLRPALVMVILAMTVQSASLSGRYLQDWRKKEALIDLMRADSAIRAADVVLISDETLDLNVFSKTYSTYVWNGMMVRAFDDARRFAVRDEGELLRLLEGGFDPVIGPEGLYYGASDFSRRDAYSMARVTVARTDVDPSTLKLRTELEVLPRASRG